jgi:hypothetical protein
VISETPGSSVPLPDTVATITRFAETVPVAALPRDADAAAVGSRFDELAGMLSTPSIG